MDTSGNNSHYMLHATGPRTRKCDLSKSLTIAPSSTTHQAKKHYISPTFATFPPLPCHFHGASHFPRAIQMSPPPTPPLTPPSTSPSRAQFPDREGSMYRGAWLHITEGSRRTGETWDAPRASGCHIGLGEIPSTHRNAFHARHSVRKDHGRVVLGTWDGKRHSCRHPWS